MFELVAVQNICRSHTKEYAKNRPELTPIVKRLDAQTIDDNDGDGDGGDEDSVECDDELGEAAELEDQPIIIGEVVEDHEGDDGHSGIVGDGLDADDKALQDALTLSLGDEPDLALAIKRSMDLDSDDARLQEGLALSNGFDTVEEASVFLRSAPSSSSKGESTIAALPANYQPDSFCEQGLVQAGSPSILGSSFSPAASPDKNDAPMTSGVTSSPAALPNNMDSPLEFGLNTPPAAPAVKLDAPLEFGVSSSPAVLPNKMDSPSELGLITPPAAPAVKLDGPLEFGVSSSPLPNKMDPPSRLLGLVLARDAPLGPRVSSSPSALPAKIRKRAILAKIAELSQAKTNLQSLVCDIARYLCDHLKASFAIQFLGLHMRKNCFWKVYLAMQIWGAHWALQLFGGLMVKLVKGLIQFSIFCFVQWP